MLNFENVKIKGEDIIKNPKISIELEDKELEFLLLTIKNSLFKGEYVELLYNLTLKLQTHYQKIKK